MASGLGKHKMLTAAPTEPWSLREKLCLATSVMKSGDQNWVSVSRAIKPFAEPGRPPDWFSQKHCASQYSELLESTEAPKRKRGERGEVVETVEDVIVRRLTAERIDELKRLIRETQEEHRKLKQEAQLIHAGHLDCRVDEVWGEIAEKRKQTEEEAEEKRKSTDASYQARQTAKTAVRRGASTVALCPQEGPSPSLEPPASDGPPHGALTVEGQPSPIRSVLVSPGFPPTMTYESSLPSNGDVCQAVLLEDSLLRKPLGQRTTPPPSPLLSELLKKGSALPGNPRPVGEGEPSGHVTGSHDLQLAPPPPPGSQATGAPTLSRLLECAPSQASVPPSFMPAPDSVSMATHHAGNPLPVDPAVLTNAGGLAVVGPYGYQHVFGGPVVSQEMEEEEEEEEEEVGGSYMGDELDLKTVGDIIAIIEEKTVEHPEVLDAAAVEAALSLCEEGGHALVGSCWGPGPFKPQDPTPGSGRGDTAAPPSRHGGPTGARTDALGVQHHRRFLPMTPLRPKPASSASDFSVAEREGCDGPHGGTRAAGGGEGEMEPPASGSEDGSSMHTASSSLQLHATASSTPSSPASSQFSMCSEDLEAIQAQKIWKKAIMLVWRAAANHRFANVFLQPVTDDIAPGYHGIVHRPMDLSTIKRNIEAGAVRSTAEFQRDMMLMFHNAVMYNSLDHDVFLMALDMQRDVLEHVQQFLATQLIMQTAAEAAAAGGGAKR
ncbi:bromodomain-containing protein 8-like, partial [Gadus chalcogrammus]|uniref:bromodomain-containing protein 8-like n=1 Tax=Gadus chalcogrammus TaxID=1042646 RepID=UPI0024C2C56F